MFKNIWRWIGCLIIVQFATVWPLILFGVPNALVWAISLVLSALLILAPTGGRIEKFFGNFVAYGIVFSLWIAGGTVGVALTSIIFDWIRPPLSLYIVAAIGCVGLVRALWQAHARSR